MNSRLSLATALLWLALPFTLVDYWRVWDQLPARMAIHFDINWRANGFTTREGAFTLTVGLVVFMLMVFNITIFFMRRSPAPSFMPWVMIAFFYATMIFVCGINHWVVQYNLNSRSASMSPAPSVELDQGSS